MFGTEKHAGPPAAAVGAARSSRRRMLRLCTLLVGLLGASLVRGDSGVEAVLHSFEAGAIDGAYPYSSLVLASDGNFYGTTYSGGTHNAGTAFKLSPGGSFSTLYNFGANVSDGDSPRAGLVQGSDGNFYGTTQSGGAHAGGTVFQLKADGSITTLYAFGAGSGDGLNPNAALIQGTDGNFYGTTQGGGSHGGGTVYKITTGGTLTTLYTFGNNSTDGIIPSVGLIQGSDGNLYGTTYFGGAHGFGTVFKVTPGGTETVLYSFAGGNDGEHPYAGVIQGSDGNFYGTTYQGGASGYGTVFKLTPSGIETVLYTFAGGSSDGAYPEAGVIQGSDGNFYGSTLQGGASGLGLVFKLTPSGTETILHAFAGASDGANPTANLVLGSDGNLYGSTSAGGSSGDGTLFKVSLH